MDLRSQLTRAGLGNLVWSTVQLELNARVYDAGTREHTASTNGLDLIYGELDRREKIYTNQEYGRGLGELIRAANTDVFDNPKYSSGQSIAERLMISEHESVLAVDKREEDYVGGASVDKPLGSMVLKGMHGALSMVAGNPDLKQFMEQMVDGYIQELDQREGLYRLKATAPEQ